MRLTSALAATLLISTAALAQPGPDAPPPGAGGSFPPGGPSGPHMNMVQRFQAANVTHDGRLTREQAEAGGMPNVARHFDEMDADRKGYVTLQDLRAYAQARRAQRAGQPPPPQ